jgi:hypothetical protein
VFLVASGGGLAFAAVRGLHTWRDVQLLRRRLDATVVPVTTSAAAIDARVAAIETRTAELERARARLQVSLGELSVILAALAETRDRLRRATGFIPR